MTLRTRAALVHRPGGSFAFEEVEIDSPRPDEVLVRVVACGICHTDLAARDGLFASRFPAVFGHEGAGVVETVGAGVTRARAGDRVLLSFSSCGECKSCQGGHPAHCKAFGKLNFGSTRLDGTSTIRTAAGEPVGACFFGQSSFAGYALTRERNLVVLDDIDDDGLALFAPLGCGIQAGAGTVLNELQPRANESFVVFGAGTVGLAALMAARLAGASPIAAVDIVPSRLEMARELGADYVVNGNEEDVGSRLGEIVGDVDHAVETTGLSRVIDTAIRSLGPKGTLSQLGVSSDEAEVSPKALGPGQRAFYSIAGDSDPQKFIPFLVHSYKEGKFPFTRLIREYPASDINEAVKDSLDGVTIKPVLRF
jgi:aryl-alcohol dehydrogenase